MKENSNGETCNSLSLGNKMQQWGSRRLQQTLLERCRGYGTRCSGHSKRPWNTMEPKFGKIIELCSIKEHIIGPRSHVRSDSPRGSHKRLWSFSTRPQTRFLEELCSLKAWVGRDHWIVDRDFNLIRTLEEKKGWIRSLSGVSTTFNEVIDELHLVDVQTPNEFYTWPK